MEKVSFSELFIFTIFNIAGFVYFLYVYKEPEESYLFGRRWMYDSDIEVSEAMKKHYKHIGIIGMVVISFTEIYLLVNYIL